MTRHDWNSRESWSRIFHRYRSDTLLLRLMCDYIGVTKMLELEELVERPRTVSRALDAIHHSKSWDDLYENWRLSSVVLRFPEENDDAIAKWHERQIRRAKYRDSIHPKLRAALLPADATCTYCGELANALDHIYPRSRGGDNRPSNLTPACRNCNSSKGARTPQEWFDSLDQKRLQSLVTIGQIERVTKFQLREAS